MPPECRGKLRVPGGLRCVRVAQRERLSHHETRRAGRSLCPPNVVFSSSASPYVHSEERCYRRLCRQWWSDRKLSIQGSLTCPLPAQRTETLDGQNPSLPAVPTGAAGWWGRLVLRTRGETVVPCHLSHHLPGALPIVVTRAFHGGRSPGRHALVLPDVIRHPAATRLDAGASRHDGRDRAAALIRLPAVAARGARCPSKRTFGETPTQAADRRPDRGKCVVFTRPGILCPGYSMPPPQNGTLRLIKSYYVNFAA